MQKIKSKKYLPGTLLKIKFNELDLGCCIVLNDCLWFNIKSGSIKQMYSVIERMCGFTTEEIK